MFRDNFKSSTMRIRHPERVIYKLNSLLMMYHEAVKIYSDARDITNNEALKIFFNQLITERNQNISALRTEVVKLNVKPQNFEGLNKLSRAYFLFWNNIKPLLKHKDTSKVLDQICSLKVWSIDNYNDLLEEHNLPLSLCKILVEQRDFIHSRMNGIKAKQTLHV